LQLLSVVSHETMEAQIPQGIKLQKRHFRPGWVGVFCIRCPTHIGKFAPPIIWRLSSTLTSSGNARQSHHGRHTNLKFIPAAWLNSQLILKSLVVIWKPRFWQVWLQGT
jgi:hypothetical protein